MYICWRKYHKYVIVHSIFFVPLHFQICLFVYNLHTSAGKLRPSNWCSDPYSSLLPQWKWRWSSLKWCSSFKTKDALAVFTSIINTLPLFFNKKSPWHGQLYWINFVELLRDGWKSFLKSGRLIGDWRRLLHRGYSFDQNMGPQIQTNNMLTIL